MSGNLLVRFDEGRVGRTARCRPLTYSNGEHSFGRPTYPFKYRSNQSIVRCHASFAAASSYRGVVSLWNP
jgi:hypothetical protein